MTVERHSPVPAGRFAGLPAGVDVRPEPFVAQVSVRGPDGGPAPRGRWIERDGITTIRLGPDEWLVTSPSLAPVELERRLAGSGSLVDVSAQRTTFRLLGPHAHDVLASGCPLDLHPRRFGAGSAAQTTVGKAGVILLALDDTATDYRILVGTSFAPYLAEWLLDAAVEYRS